MTNLKKVDPMATLKKATSAGIAFAENSLPFANQVESISFREEVVALSVAGQPARTFTPEQAEYLNNVEIDDGYLEAYHISQFSAWVEKLVEDGFFCNYPEDYRCKVKFASQLIRDLSTFVHEESR